MNEKTYRYSYEDKESMNLLDIQQIAVLLVIYSDLLSYRAVLEGKELINSKYNDSINISKLNLMLQNYNQYIYIL